VEVPPASRSGRAFAHRVRRDVNFATRTGLHAEGALHRGALSSTAKALRAEGAAARDQSPAGDNSPVIARVAEGQQIQSENPLIRSRYKFLRLPASKGFCCGSTVAKSWSWTPPGLEIRDPAIDDAEPVLVDSPGSRAPRPSASAT
jgi:hypothetical protein